MPGIDGMANPSFKLLPKGPNLVSINSGVVGRGSWGMQKTLLSGKFQGVLKLCARSWGQRLDILFIL